MKNEDLNESPLAMLSAMWIAFIVPAATVLESCYVAQVVYDDNYPLRLFVFGFPAWLYAAIRLFPVLIYPMVFVHLMCQGHMFYLYGEQEGYMTFYHLTYYSYPLAFIIGMVAFSLRGR